MSALDLDAIEQRAIAAGAYGWWEPADRADVAAAIRGAFLGHTQTMADADARHIIGMDPDTTLALVDALARVSREAEALRAKVAAVEALHAKEPDVVIDYIHRGLTPVYGDGCSECGGAWPCDTLAALATGEGK